MKVKYFIIFILIIFLAFIIYKFVFFNKTNDLNVDIYNNDENTQIDFSGNWYIDEDSYNNHQLIEDILAKNNSHEISEEDFIKEMESEINKSFASLNVKSYSKDSIIFDFELTSPAPLQRVASLEDITVNLENNAGNFYYTDNWGNSGDGTITLVNESINLNLKTVTASSGALWGVEGSYVFSYKN